MIRFSCGTCNHLLRAPAILAGKKGKCACCGAVNQVPEALSVEVARAPAASPFRSTADLELGGTLAGTAEVEGGRFLAAAPSGATIAERPEEFFDEVTARLHEVIEEIDQNNDAPAQTVPAARVGVTAAAMERASARSSMDDLSVIPFDAPPAGIEKRGIFGALVVGIVMGFCLGLLAGKWIW
jgi:hypothetical protein